MTKKKRIAEGDDEEEEEQTFDEGKKKKKKNRDETDEEKAERREKRKEKREKKKAKKSKDDGGKKRKGNGEKSKSKRKDDNDDEDDEEERDEVIVKKKRRHNVQEDDEEEEDDEDKEEEEEEIDENLNEFQKEAILYDRQQKRKEKEEREAAKKKLQIEQKTTRSSTRETKKPAINKALQDYVAQKNKEDDDESTDDETQKKNNSNAQEESSEEEQKQQEEEEEREKEGEQERGGEQEEEDDGDDGSYSEVTIKQILGLQVRRLMLEKIFGEPWFKDFIIKKFVRVNLGERTDQTTAYRMAEIVGVRSYPRPYKFGNRNTQLALLVRHGKADRIFAMTVISNGSITDDELERWKKEMNRIGERILSSEDALVIKKSADFHRTSFKYTPDIVQDLLDKKKKENLKTFNLTAERNNLMLARATAQENGDADEVTRLQAEIEYLDNEEGMIRRRKGAYKAGLVALNIRNKERNLLAREQIHKEINKAERTSGKMFQQEDYYSTKMTFPAQIWTAPEKEQDRDQRFKQAQAELEKRKKELEDANRVKQKAKPSALVLTDPVEEERKEIEEKKESALVETEVSNVFKSISPSDIAYQELVDKHGKIFIDISHDIQRPNNTALLRREPLGDFHRLRSLREYLATITKA